MNYRKELIAKMQKIVADAGDTMTDEQTEQFNKLKAGVDLIDAGGADAETGAVPRPSEQKHNRPNPAESVSDNKAGWIDAQGKPIKVYSKDDKFGDNKYSIGNYIRALATGDVRYAENERELLAQTTGSASGGGVLVPSPLSNNLIDLARANMVLVDAGAVTVPMEATTLEIARVTADPTVSVKAELDALTHSGPTFDSVTLNAYTLAAYAEFSAELIADAPNAAEIIQNTMAQAIAREFDNLGINGTGTAEPTGIVNTSGINSITGVSSFDYDDVLNALQLNQADNCYTSNAYTLSPASSYAMNILKTTDGAYLQAPEDVQNLSKFVTTAVNDTDLIVADYSNMILGLRQGITLQISEVAGDMFKKHGIAIRAILRGDWALARPNHFCLVSTDNPSA